MKKDQKILFLGKKHDSYCQQAKEFCEEHFKHVVSFLGVWGDPLPKDILKWEGDYIISYLSRWCIPSKVLKKAEQASINFHPASPEYPGIGCTNFALYDEVQEYGVTCHFMDSEVDTGDIIAVKRFPVYAEDNVESLLKRSYEHQQTLFFEIMDKILKGETLPSINEQWSRNAITREELNQLRIITGDMNEMEIKRRTRAISYKEWKPIRIGAQNKNGDGLKGVK